METKNATRYRKVGNPPFNGKEALKIARKASLKQRWG